MPTLAERATAAARTAAAERRTAAEQRTATAIENDTNRLRALFPDATVLALDPTDVVRASKHRDEWGGGDRWRRSVVQKVRRYRVDDVILNSDGGSGFTAVVPCADCRQDAEATANGSATISSYVSAPLIDYHLTKLGAALIKPTRCADCTLAKAAATCDRCGRALSGYDGC